MRYFLVVSSRMGDKTSKIGKEIFIHGWNQDTYQNSSLPKILFTYLRFLEQ